MSDVAIVSPPRLLWRRLCAFYLDIACAWFLLAILLWCAGFNSFDIYYLNNSNSENLESWTIGPSLSFSLGSFDLPIKLTTSNCGLTSEDVYNVISKDIKESSIENRQLQFCLDRVFGVPSEASINWTSEVTTQSGVVQKEARSMPLHLTGWPFKCADLFGIMILISTSAACTALWSTTPGKRLLGLRFKVGAPKHALRREVIKNLPALIVILPFIPFNLEWLKVPDITIFGADIVGVTVLIAQISAVTWLRIYPLKNENIAFFWSNHGEVVRVSKHKIGVDLGDSSPPELPL